MNDVYRTADPPATCTGCNKPMELACEICQKRFGHGERIYCPSSEPDGEMKQYNIERVTAHVHDRCAQQKASEAIRIQSVVPDVEAIEAAGGRFIPSFDLARTSPASQPPLGLVPIELLNEMLKQLVAYHDDSPICPACGRVKDTLVALDLHIRMSGSDPFKHSAECALAALLKKAGVKQ